MKRIALSLIALAALSMPAQAQNFLDLPSWQHWNLNTMSTDEQARIQNGLRNGTLTPGEASRLQNRLNEINNLKSRLGVNGLSTKDRLKIDSQLDKLAQQIYHESRDGERNRWLGSKPWDWVRNNNAQNNLFHLNAWQHWNLDTMTTDEEARINAGVRNGSLTREEANRLRDRLNRVNALRAQLMVGGMSQSERIKLDSEIDKLAQAIYRETNDSSRANWLGKRPWDWARNWHGGGAGSGAGGLNNLSSWQHWNLNNMTVDEQARINAGLRNGSLTRAEATALQNRLNQINQLKSQLSAGGLSLAERQRLDRELDDLSQQIFRESRDGDRSRWLGTNPYDWSRNWRNDNNPRNDWKRDNREDHREAKQDRREQRGDWNNQREWSRRDANDAFTNKEARNLGKEVNKYENRKDRMEASGGGLSAKEQRKLDRQAERIERKARKDRND